MYSCQSVFTLQFSLEQFSREFKNPFKSYKLVSKTYRLENAIFDLFFLLHILYFDLLLDEAELTFSREKMLQNVSKYKPVRGNPVT